MRLSAVVGALLHVMVGCKAFVLVGNTASTTFHRPSNLHMAVELKPEPLGGDEVTALSSMDGSRMKNMVGHGTIWLA